MLSAGDKGPSISWMYPMQDLMKDWRRWRIEERVVAVLVFGFVMSTPLAFAVISQLH